MRYTGTMLFLRGLVMACLTAVTAANGVMAQQSGPRDPLTVIQAVRLAQQTHPSVGVARASEAAASAAVGQTRAQWWPFLGTGANLLGYNEPMIVAPIHGFTEQQFQRIEFEKTLIQGNVSLGWTLFDGGARGNRIRGAESEAAGAVAAVAAVEQGLTALVTAAYLRVLSARGVLDAREQRIASLAAERRRVQQFLAEGQAAEVELLRVEAALAEAEAESVATAAQLDLAERELARLVNVDLSRVRVDNLAPVSLPADAALEERTQLILRSAANNPELERARQQLGTAQAAHRGAKASWLPRFDVQGSYQAYSSTAGNYSDLWSVGLGIKWPIFTGGERSNTVARAGALAEAAGEELRLVELQVQEDVDRALNGALETHALVAALARAVRHQTEVVRIEQLTLEAGAGTQTDYLRAEADLSRGRSLLVEAQHAEIAARVELARVVGELTADWLARNLEIGR
ncbi:MAG TPA: TolC family protein [Gemmatimonadota bacterium]|nr:TolC family protein [Gemmatimonadota bacterium]